MGRENGSKERRGDGMSGMHRGAGWTGERRNYGPAVKNCFRERLPTGIISWRIRRNKTWIEGQIVGRQLGVPQSLVQSAATVRQIRAQRPRRRRRSRQLPMPGPRWQVPGAGP